MGFFSWGMAPMMDGCQTDYFPFPKWVSLAESHAGWFHVAIFPPPDEHLDSSYRRFTACWESCAFDYLLLDSCNRIVAWKIGSKGEVARDSLLPFEGGNVPPAVEVVRSFVKSRYGDDAEVVSPLYIHDEHAQKLELVVPDFEIIDQQLMAFFRAIRM